MSTALQEHLATVQQGAQPSIHGTIPEIDISEAESQVKDEIKGDPKLRSNADARSASLTTTKQGDNHCTECTSLCICRSKQVSDCNFDVVPNAKVDSMSATMNDAKDSAKCDSNYYFKGKSMSNNHLDRKIKSMDDKAKSVQHNNMMNVHQNAKQSSNRIPSVFPSLIPLLFPGTLKQ